MTKAELVGKMSSGAKISKAAAEKALEAFLDGVQGALKKGDRITLVGFGTFSVSKRKARKGRNPITGEEMTIAAKKATKVPKFTFSKGFKEEVLKAKIK